LSGDRPDPPDQASLEFLARHLAPPKGVPPGDCPGADALIRFEACVLRPEEHDAVEEHLSWCERCRAIVVVLARERAAAPRERGARMPVLRRRPLLAAAALLAAVGIGGALWLLVPRRGTDARLAASARELARARADLFSDFRPLGPEERAAARPPATRGGFPLLHPQGTVLEPRPAFRWETDGSVSRYEVSLYALDGTLLWKVACPASPLEFPSTQPDLEPGATYLWQVAREGAQGRESSQSRSFRVALPQEVRAFQDGRQEIEKRVGDELRWLVLAHFATRRGCLGEAESAAREYCRAKPDDVVGRETLRHVLALQGSSEAR
jgi:hypothetical protein